MCAHSYAIAYATLAHLVSRIRPLTLFATHYHALTTEFADNALVQMRHMAFVVDAHQYVARIRGCDAWEVFADAGAAGADPPPHRGQVVFMYKLAPGAAAKSFGMNVAGMAGVPAEVRDRGSHHTAPCAAASV